MHIIQLLKGYIIFTKINNTLKQLTFPLLLGGHWNCTRHLQNHNCRTSSSTLAASILCEIISENYFIDAWRKLHPTIKQYTWVMCTQAHEKKKSYYVMVFSMYHPEINQAIEVCTFVSFQPLHCPSFVIKSHHPTYLHSILLLQGHFMNP